MPYGSLAIDKLTASTGQVFSPASSIMRNRIINGGMVIDQRNAGASVTPNNSVDVFPCDRFSVQVSQNSKCTAQQVTTAPTGFKNSLKITSSSAYSVLTNDYFSVYHKIEGYNIADMAFGGASASTFTISFWVRSSLTGTFGGSVYNNAFNRTYPFTYAISAIDTWEQKTITIAGDQSGTWTTDNTTGLAISFGLGAGTTYSGTANAWVGSGKFTATGAVSVVGTNAATWYVTGVQLEAGTVASQFEYRQYGTELALCQRYYQAMTFGSGAGGTYGPYGCCRNASTVCVSVQTILPMRASPTTNITNSGASVLKQDGNTPAISSFAATVASVNEVAFEVVSSGLNTTGCAGFYGGSFSVTASSEL